MRAPLQIGLDARDESMDACNFEPSGILANFRKSPLDQRFC